MPALTCPEEPYAISAESAALRNLVTTLHLAAADRRTAVFADVELVFAALGSAPRTAGASA